MHLSYVYLFSFQLVIVFNTLMIERLSIFFSFIFLCMIIKYVLFCNIHFKGDKHVMTSYLFQRIVPLVDNCSIFSSQRFFNIVFFEEDEFGYDLIFTKRMKLG